MQLQTWENNQTQEVYYWNPRISGLIESYNDKNQNFISISNVTLKIINNFLKVCSLNYSIIATGMYWPFFLIKRGQCAGGAMHTDPRNKIISKDA